MYIKINNIIYDISDYIDFHPGGKLILLPFLSNDKNNVIDATKEWKLYHPKNAEKILSKLPKINNNSKEELYDKSILSRIKNIFTKYF
jgi:cytochrome b involved in lipid metabolism